LRIALIASLAVFAWLQLGQLGHPLIWQDEGETVMFGQRILEHGFPKVDDGRNVVYGMGVSLAQGTKDESGAYIGSLWGQYYYAAIGVALAAGVDDLYARTARLRLPFVLAGIVGLLLIGWVASGALTPDPMSRVSVAIGYVLMLCTSTSLMLHLREVRYYALVVLLLGALVVAQRRLSSRDDLPVAWISVTTALLWLLFNVFYPAAVTVAVWLVVEAAVRCLRGRGSALERVRGCAALWLPAVLTALLALPIVAWFEVLRLSQLYSDRYAFDLLTWLANLRAALHFLLRFEWLAPLLLIEASLFVLRRRRGVDPSHDAARATVASLGRLCAIWLLLGARNPIFFERYFVALSPLIAAMLTLDAAVLWREARRLGPPERAASSRRLVAIAMAVVALGMLGLKRVELAGHLAQLREPYRGPLDFVIPYLRRAHEDPSALLIATNYEAEPYVYYLGSRVVGRFHAETPEATALEQAARVDVVVPRVLQPRQLDRLRGYLDQGRFERREFPVADLPYNNIPELDRGRVLTTTHLFRTPVPVPSRGPFYIHERVREASSTRAETEQPSE
jgi:hypothetical protein